MPALRPLLSSAVVRATGAATTRTTAAARPFSTTPRAAAGGGSHESQYDPPTGWLWGVKPGEKYVNEGWENLMFYGFGGSLVVFTIAYAFKPDTSIQTWALEEARRRLEAEGILEDPHPEVKK
ncbi:ESSS subunit of NADH:ubiquinone oxidoreductase-domain-containing protein [Apodospora peruviana]|uniref:NADH dehydrogenase [ubiquinone] 1 beta subcomplex subunit 11, mitochondrial n=1 Tax=Apodospora peruviana TaxID=516989 RepID=A0AAE0I0J0_9PEZI|nr:ESSS subunit of NADH:ubiquinone oxidoreductase-domain-containing protein [Apodospora peruviana]